MVAEITYLHCYREIGLSLGWEEHIHSFLGEGLISCGCASNFYNVKFATLHISNSETKKVGRLWVSFQFDLGKCPCMTFNWLADFPLNGVQLHSSNYSVLLLQEAHKQLHQSII